MVPVSSGVFVAGNQRVHGHARRGGVDLKFVHARVEAFVARSVGSLDDDVVKAVRQRANDVVGQTPRAVAVVHHLRVRGSVDGHLQHGSGIVHGSGQAGRGCPSWR